jgi:Mg-chelatase subunit ChlD
MEENANDNMHVDSFNEGEQLDGNLESNLEDEHLAHSVVDVDMDDIDEGMLVDAAFNNNRGTFMPDMMFKDMVRNFKNAEKLYGQTFIRQVSGYDPRYIQNNIKVPEFQKELQRNMETKAKELQDKGLMKKSGKFTDEALLTAALFLIEEEFEKTEGKTTDVGEQVHFAAQTLGEKSDTRPFKKGDPFKDISMKTTLAKAIRRGRRHIIEQDLESHQREARQKLNIIYALDTSGSMKGKKLSLAKRAGVALANRALKDRNNVGLVLFDQELNKKVAPTNDLLTIVRPLVDIVPGYETDIALAIHESAELLRDAKGLKHIVLLTDGVHTTSKRGKKAVIGQVLQAAAQDISITIVGIHLDEEGVELAREIVDASNGKLLAANSADELGGLVIADYMSLP